MNTSLFLPKEIKVGFEERRNTYTGKLAYVVYFDEKGVLRKEKSFESWRDHSIEPEQYENVPTSGFVLNRKAGGYDTGWNHRQTYVRVYDPRGFEFEITVENLLYILDNTSSIVGKGLEGEFVYSWDGKDLVLLPVSAPEYEGLKRLNELRHRKEYVKAKDLKVGATYLTNNNNELVYLGKFDSYDEGVEYLDGARTYVSSKHNKKYFYFAKTKKREDGTYRYVTYPAVTRKLVEMLDEESHVEFSDMLEGLNDLTQYSPIDESKSVRRQMTLKEFQEYLEEEHYYCYIIAKNGKEYRIDNDNLSFHGEVKTVQNENYSWQSNQYRTAHVKNRYEQRIYEIKTFEDIYNILQPHTTDFYLENGRFYTTEFRKWSNHEPMDTIEE